MKNVQVICHPSNLVLPYCQSVMPSHALLNRYYTITVNRTGTEKELNFTGQSIICNPYGNVIERGSTSKEEILMANIDIDQANDKWMTENNHIINDRRSDLYGNLKINES